VIFLYCCFVLSNESLSNRSLKKRLSAKRPVLNKQVTLRINDYSKFTKELKVTQKKIFIYLFYIESISFHISSLDI